MDNRPIGFFDSGLGGLTSIPHLKRLLPKEKIIYDYFFAPFEKENNFDLIAKEYVEKYLKK